MFNFDKRPKNLFFCVGLNKPFFPNPTAPLGCNWTSLEINPPIAKWTGPLGWTPLSPSLLHVNCPVGLIPQLKWTTPLSWILHRLPPKGNGTVELDTKCTAFPKSTPPLSWISHPFPHKGNGNVGFALLSQPLPSSPSFLDARALFLKQYTKQTINTIFTIFPTTTMHYFSNELCWFSISRKHTRSWQTHFSNFLCTDLHKHKLLQTNKLKEEKKTSKPSLPLKIWNLIWRARNIFLQ